MVWIPTTLPKELDVEAKVPVPISWNPAQVKERASLDDGDVGWRN